MKRNNSLLLLVLLAVVALVVVIYSKPGFNFGIPAVTTTTAATTAPTTAASTTAPTTAATTTAIASCNDLCVSKNYTSGSCVPSCLAGYLHATEWTKCEYSWEKCCCKPKV